MKDNDSKRNEHNVDMEKIVERAALKAAKEAFEKGIQKVDAAYLKSAKEIFKKAIEAIETAEAEILEGEKTLEYIESIGVAEALASSFKEKAK
jgi:hypothetical protein